MLDRHQLINLIRQQKYKGYYICDAYQELYSFLDHYNELKNFLGFIVENVGNFENFNISLPVHTWDDCKKDNDILFIVTCENCKIKELLNEANLVYATINYRTSLQEFTRQNALNTFYSAMLLVQKDTNILTADSPKSLIEIQWEVEKQILLQYKTVDLHELQKQG